MAVVQAEAGFDSIGLSDMMDGRVGVIRDALDEAGTRHGDLELHGQVRQRVLRAIS